MENITFSINVTSEKLEELASEIFQNFPEYGIYAFQCKSYDYKNFVYIFIDIEDGKKYVVSKRVAVEGLTKFIQKQLSGELKYSGFQNITDLLDPCQYDADSLDGILQLALFNEIRYS